MASRADPWAPVHALIASRTGMALSGPQLRRLDERLGALGGGRTAHHYALHLQSAAGASELEQLISAVVVHKTDLFRDEVQLEAFRAEVLAPRVERSKQPLRVWSAGCATGEEVATLLVLLARQGADPASTVLGTDISEAALARARALSFPLEALRRVPEVLRERYFVRGGGRATLAPGLRAQASFQLHNLMDTPYPLPEKGEGFDIIFCRNVLIYFTAEAFQRTVVALAGRLAPGGTLVLATTEPLLQVPPTLRVQRGEQAFFFVRVEDGAESDRSGGAGASLSSTAERGRDAGSFPTVAPSARGTPGKRDSGRVPTVVPGSTPGKRDSGPVPSVAPGETAGRRASGRTPATTLGASSGRHESLDPSASASGGMPGTRDSGPVRTVSPAGAPGKRESGSVPVVSPAMGTRTHDSGREPSIAPGDPASGDAPTRVAPLFTGTDAESPLPPTSAREAPTSSAPPHAQADWLFACVLDGASTGMADAAAEQDLRRCLELDADHAAARYLLGLLLEQCGRPAEAAAEYRRALDAVESGRARSVPFFLNLARLRVACAHAVERLDATARR